MAKALTTGVVTVNGLQVQKFLKDIQELFGFNFRSAHGENRIAALWSETKVPLYFEQPLRELSSNEC